jgi:hypothetical protein
VSDEVEADGTDGPDDDAASERVAVRPTLPDLAPLAHQPDRSPAGPAGPDADQ